MDRHPPTLGNVDDREPSAAGPIRPITPIPGAPLNRESRRIMRLRQEKPPAHRRVTWQAASLLPAYPDQGQPAGLAMMRATVNALAENDGAPLPARADHLWTTPLITAAAEYSETFNWRRWRTPFLTDLFRPYIIYRSRDAARPGDQLESRPRRRGW